MKSVTLAALTLCAAALAASARQEAHAPAPITEARLGAARNVHRSGALFFSGQFAPADVAALTDGGVTRVITARMPGELDWDEAAAVSAAGMTFESVPFQAPDSLTDDVFDRVRGLLRESSGITLYHCGSANRVAATWLPFRVLDEGVALETALAEAEVVGLRTPAYRELALAYIEREQSDASVKPGINDSFKNPELDVDSYVARFEVESREVYSARHAVVAALGLEPGMRVADVGAGTGLYSMLLADAVGTNGWVWAVDIAPRFLQHVRSSAREQGLKNIGTVLCPERAVGLPPESVDLVYICDTYHHFEFPAATLASIERALRPGGRLVVIEFERIPGVSSDWIMDHVRADKATFRREIEGAGFALRRELSVEGLEENYVLEFIKAPQ